MDGTPSLVEGPFTVDALWFYPVTTEAAPAVTDAEHAALERMRKRGVSISRLRRHDVIAHLLLESARRGVVTNAPGPLGRWGRKDQLEYQLRWFTRMTGKNVPRPETHPVVGAQLAPVLANFGSRGLDCIIKPADGARSEGVRLVPSNGASPPIADAAQVIVQELVKQPLLSGGSKVDLRVYLLVDGASRADSRRLDPILVRVASAPYQRLREAAEITNTSYRRRLGLPPHIAPLADIDTIAQPIRQEIIAGVDALATDLLDAVFLWKETQDWSGNRTAARLLIWGLDVLMAVKEDGHVSCNLLEVNVYPQLFRGDPICDSLVDRLMLEDYLPALEQACKRRHDGVRTA
jgi:hypothetical protein